MGKYHEKRSIVKGMDIDKVHEEETKAEEYL
jgi:hypothetical protein